MNLIPRLSAIVASLPALRPHANRRIAPMSSEDRRFWELFHQHRPTGQSLPARPQAGHHPARLRLVGRGPNLRRWHPDGPMPADFWPGLFAVLALVLPVWGASWVITP